MIGSGFLPHHMSYAFRPETPVWARAFDEWVTRKLVQGEWEELAEFYDNEPSSRLALPTWEHYAPLLVAAGAGRAGERVSFPITGFWMDGAFTRRSVQFG